MAHDAQKQWCLEAKRKFPDHFSRARVLDVGSMDINGNNRGLFVDCDYTGLDLDGGPNVDLICRVHLLPWSDGSLDCVISTEAMEHDRWWPWSLRRMGELLRPGGLLVITCATIGRAPHGTYANDPIASPCTRGYYRNLTEADFRAAVDVQGLFSRYLFDRRGHDLRFWGVRGQN